MLPTYSLYPLIIRIIRENVSNTFLLTHFLKIVGKMGKESKKATLAVRLYPIEILKMGKESKDTLFDITQT